MTTIAVHRDEDDPILFVERNERVDEYEELPENSVKYVRRSASQRLDIPRFRIRFEQDDEGRKHQLRGNAMGRYVSY